MPLCSAVSSKVTPAQFVAGLKGQIYVLYRTEGPDPLCGSLLLQLAQSEDGGGSFAEPIEIASKAVEGAVCMTGMINLFPAPDGGLYASWLDYREMKAHANPPPKDEPEPAPQLRLARSTDGGRSFAKSTLVTKPV